LKTFALFLLLIPSVVWAAEPGSYPPGFFVQSRQKTSPEPLFYNLDTHRLQSFPLKASYAQFIDFFWDRERGRVFFSARQAPRDPFRVYVKAWPGGDEKPVYENPLGPFRFLLSPDGKRLALQVMGPAAWPILAVHEWETQATTLLGQGYSPDWSLDGQRLLFLSIPGALPSWLDEYSVQTDTSTQILSEPVMEAAYTDDADQIILKTASQSKKCDVFQLWNRRKNRFYPFVPPTTGSKTCVFQRQLGAFPGHQFFYFKESKEITRLEEQNLIVVDVWGGRLQELPRADWEPSVNAVDPTTLVVGQDPLYVLRADGTGGRLVIPGVEMIRPR
jgi:hypothetical protein